ncbi:MAG: hypothetical protein K2P78_09505 [Gemmataceae bacterium]|nr:hypothetical protein [Gemmataceae bacterium]
MRRWMAAPLVFAAAFGLSVAANPTPAAAAAQDKGPTEETIPTADGVKLRGLFHRSPVGGPNDPVVVLLYPPGLDRSMTKGDWPGLIKMLNDKKFHVFQFDWRGHGKSTDILDAAGDQTNPFAGFWANRVTGPYNVRYIKGSTKKPVKNDVFVKEVAPAYWPVYVEDLAAIRVHLDQKNDQGDLNSSSIYVIGAEDAATLGFLWMAAEWQRPGIHPLLGNGQHYKLVPTQGIVIDPEGGRDFAGAVWLSGGRPANVPSINPALAQNWVKMSIKMRDNNPMLFLYGEKDANGKNAAGYFFEDVLVAKGNAGQGIKKLDQTFVRDVKGTNLRGVGLLGKNTELKTEDTIIAYLEQLQKERVAVTVKKRGYVSQYYINLPSFGVSP